MSKAVSYALTVTELGEETVHRFQGKEPSGRRRNEIVLDEVWQTNIFEIEYRLVSVKCIERQASQPADQRRRHHVGLPSPPLGQARR